MISYIISINATYNNIYINTFVLVITNINVSLASSLIHNFVRVDKHTELFKTFYFVSM